MATYVLLENNVLLLYYYKEHGSVPGNQAIQDALGAIAGKAFFGGETRTVHVRYAEHEGRIYVDLVDPQWRVVEIAAEGWKVIVDAASS